MYYSVCYKLSTFRTETLRPACNSSIDDVIVVVVAVITYMCVLHCCAENDAIIIVRKIVFAATSSGQQDEICAYYTRTMASVVLRAFVLFCGDANKKSRRCLRSTVYRISPSLSNLSLSLYISPNRLTSFLVCKVGVQWLKNESMHSKKRETRGYHLLWFLFFRFLLKRGTRWIYLDECVFFSVSVYTISTGLRVSRSSRSSEIVDRGVRSFFE